MCNKIIFRFAFLILIFLFVLSPLFAVEDSLDIHFPSYFGEEDNVYDEIHYLENEPLAFDFCADKDVSNVRFYLKCGTFEEDLNVVKNYNRDGCFFSNYDLRDLSCAKFDLFIDYQVGTKKKIMKRSFKKQQESLLVNYIIEKDYETLNDLDLSYYLIVLNDIQDKTKPENVDAYESLKNDRNNEYKCWPDDSCNLLTTTSVLRNLKLAGYEKDSRMLEDGKIYLERKVIDDPQGDSGYASEEKVYEFEIDMVHNFSSNVECDLEVDDEDSKTYEFDEDSDDEDKRIEKKASDFIGMSCEDDIDFMILRVYEEKVYDKEYDDEDQFDYTIDADSQDEYDEFKYRIKITHDFGIAEDIDCELEVDSDDAEDYSFDIDSDEDDLIIEGYFDDEIVFDCDNDEFDMIKFDVYANVEDEVEFEDDDEFEYDVDFESEDSFEFDIVFEYEFEDDDEELNCSLEIDDLREKNYRFESSDEVSGLLRIEKKKVLNSLSFSCEEDLEKLEFGLFDIFGRKQVDEEYFNVRSLSYSVPTDFSDYECIGESGFCDFDPNINSLIALSDASLDKKTVIESFVDSFIAKGDNNEYYVDNGASSFVVDTGKYLFYSVDDDLESYLKFEQNNDGSWGSGSDVDKIIPSAWAVLGVQEADSDSEHVEDGKKWIYYNEPTSGWSSVEKNAMAYYAIKEKLKPYLKITTRNEIEGFTQFEIENPTIYNLKDVRIEFEDKLDEYLSFTQNLGDIDGQDYLSFNISSKSTVVGDKSGVMVISGVDGKSNELELLRMTINVKGPRPFEVSPQKVFVSEDLRMVSVVKENVVESFSYECSYVNPFNGLVETMTVESVASKVSFSNPDLVVGDYSFDLNCVGEDKKEFDVPVEVEVISANKTFEVEQKSLILESYNDFSVNVTNVGDGIETLSLGVVGDYEGYIFPSESTKKLAVGESREVYFAIPSPDLLAGISQNASGYVVIKSNSGYEKKLSVNFFVSNVSEGDSGSKWMWYLLVGVIVVIMVAVVLWRRKVIMDKELEEQQHHEEDEEFDFDFE